MKAWLGSMWIGFAVLGTIGAISCDKNVGPTSAPAELFTPVPSAAYGALEVDVKSGGQTVKRYFAAVVSHHKSTTTQPDHSFNYLLARLDPRSTESTDPSSDKVLNDFDLNGLTYRGNLIAYFFGGWGRIRNDHITTASEAMVRKSEARGQLPPFAFVPLPKAADGTARYAVISFGAESDAEVPLYATRGEQKASLPPRHYLIVNVAQGDRAHFERPGPTGSQGEEIRNTEVLEAYQNITALRDALRLP